ncbi:AAA family ATPase [Streptomyces sp. NPDC093224]|uniref:AAA family ATPase n=1 Tax=Streptomyces sp. NPDC093224 TaxID=3155198 RepID=UPI00341A9CD0
MKTSPTVIDLHEAETSAVLHGRDDELDALTRLLTASGGGCVPVLLRGGWGSGKTSLLRTVLARARRDPGLHVVSAWVDPLERDLPFGMVRQLFEHMAAVDAPVPPGAPDSPDTPRTSLATHSDPYSVPWTMPPEALAARTAGQEMAALGELYRQVARLAGHKRLVVIIDDLQRADPASLRWLRYLLCRGGELPVVVLAALAEEGTHPNTDSLAAVLPLFRHQLTLGGLAQDAVDSLAEEILGHVPPAAFTAACREASGGIPLLLHAVLRGIRARRPTEAGLTAPIAEYVPADLGPALLARMEPLAAHAATTAAAVAVLGGSPSTDLLAATVGLPLSQVADAVHGLVRAGCATQTGTEVSLVCESLAVAVSTTVLPSRRMELHVRAARSLHADGAPAERVAAHLLPGALGEPWAPEVLARAAERAYEQGDSARAAAYVRRALREDAQEEPRARLLALLGRLELSFDVPVAVGSLERSLELCQEPAERAVVARGLAGALLALDRYPDALQVLRATCESLRKAGPADAMRLEIDLIHIALTNAASAPDAVRRLKELDVDDAPDTGVRRPLAALLSLREAMAGRAGEAVSLARTALERGADPMSDASVVYYDAVISLRAAGETELALEYAEAAVGQARERASVLGHVQAIGVRASMLCGLGRLLDSQADALSALAQLQGIGIGPSHSFAVFATATLMESLVGQGRPDEAEELLRRADLAGELNSNWVNDYVLMVRGRLRVAQGRLDKALADFLLCGERAGARGTSGPGFHPWRSEAALVHTELRQGDAARALAEAELALAHGWGAPETVGTALRAMGLVTGGPEGLELLREAVETLRGTPARVRFAQALADFGVLARKAGRLPEARACLQEAASVAHECGATPVTDLALAELRAVGDRPRTRTFQGAAALTPTERRVTELAVQGMTNREIAQRLYVGLRTVEAHLTSSYGKLAIDGRSGLAHALAEASCGP